MTRVCPEVPGGDSRVLRSIGGLLAILTLPIAFVALMKIIGPAPASAKTGKQKYAALVCPFHPRALRYPGNPRERWIALLACHRDDDLTSLRCVSAEES
ncbi:hypothetical protein [Mesorhizobium sp. IMUNJ 23232]|uniref:hypothetical protein n=1 Tax=Mesorhizobium sp. IMUNJ 23232 TaxID=3376064 RepID=UPI0037873AEF